LNNAQGETFDAMGLLDKAAELADEISEAVSSGSIPAIGNLPDLKANIQYQLGLAAKSLQDLVQAADFFKASLRFLSPEQVRH